MQKRSARRSSLLHSKRNLLSFELLEPRLNLALDVPAFSSLPGANHTIYLDFDGHVTTGTSWNNGATINSPAYSSDADTANFSPSELSVIERTFYRAAEDFAPFQVNVTTVAPSVDDLRNTGGADAKWGVRVVVTRDVAFNCGCGGIAYIDSFDWNSDTPVFVFNTSEIGVAEAVSHEVGHSLGLAHDGTSAVSYYQGHGLGTDSTYWSTIMGVGYYVDVSQWDRGEYTGANNGSATANYNKGPDDLQVITNYNGFGFKADDHGNDSTTASALTAAGATITGSGLISTRTDVDYFSFVTGGGSITLNVNPAAIGANLDIEASLYDSTGALVASSNPFQALNASITTVVASGQYFLKIDGVGAGTPTATTPTGYSDYGSIGAYTISGTVGAITGDALAIVATDTSKNEANSGATAFTFTVNRTGDTTGTSTVNYSVTGSGASPASASDFVGGTFPGGSLTFAPGITSQVISINVQGDTTFESSEGFAVSLSAPSSSTVISTSTANGTILNDDAAPAAPTLGISATSANKAEGTSSGSTRFVFTITRSGSLTAASSVRYTVSGTGTSSANNTDFSGGFARNVLVNFPVGVSTVDIGVNVRADSRTEPNETFRVVLSNAVGATISTASATGTIQNDDGAAAARDEENGQSETIAVADPLWMFVPPEFLSAEELAVPVVTWINGVAHIGDLAHEHDEDDHDHDHGDVGSELEVATTELLAAPIDFSVGSQRLSTLLSQVSPATEGERLTNSLATTRLASTGSSETQAQWQDLDLLANNSVGEQSPSQLFDAIDLAFSEDAEEKWLG